MDLFLEHGLTWLGILFCLSQSGMFSGLNLAFFSVSRLRLEAEVEAGSPEAERVLAKRRDANFLLATILWGNVAVNVLLTLLTDSVMTGVGAFLFSTVVITFIGEIIPQAYFSRHALRMAYLLSPVMALYQILLYPVAKPVALGLDAVLGRESILYFQEADLREVLKQHIGARGSDINRLEGTGALNFLSIDDLFVSREGERVDPESVVELSFENGSPRLPDFTARHDDPFMQKLGATDHKWIIFTDGEGEPRLALDTDGYLRAAFFEQNPDLLAFCHPPLVVRDPRRPLGEVIGTLRDETRPGDIVEDDVILVWGEEKRVITGTDILGRLLRGT